MIPETLEGWTLDVVRQVAASGMAENDVFDLKGDLQPAEHQRKPVAAFANTRGGFLVFGVTNDRQVTGVENGELARDFGIKLGAELEPSVEYRFGVPLTLDTGRIVFVCHVPRSNRGPHAVMTQTGCLFLKRAPSGSNVPMTYEEVRSLFVDAARLRSHLAQLSDEVQRIRERANELNLETTPYKEGVSMRLAFGRCDASTLRALLPLVWEVIADRGGLVDALKTLRDECDELDRALAATSEGSGEPFWHGGGAMMRIALTKRYAPNIRGNADRALQLLKGLRA